MDLLPADPAAVLTAPLALEAVGTPDLSFGGVATAALCAAAEGFAFSCLDPFTHQKASFTFQTSHTRPTRSGPGLRVGLPGRQPAGVASAPPAWRTY